MGGRVMGRGRFLLALGCISVAFLFVITMYAFREVVDQDAARFGLMARGRQEEGQYFELDLGRIYNVGKVELLSSHLFDYPRGLRILTSLDGEAWDEVLRSDSCFPPMSCIVGPSVN